MTEPSSLTSGETGVEIHENNDQINSWSEQLLLLLVFKNPFQKNDVSVWRHFKLRLANYSAWNIHKYQRFEKLHTLNCIFHLQYTV